MSAGGDRGRPPLTTSWWRLWTVQGSFEPEGQQWTGWLVCLAPWLRSQPDASRRELWLDTEPSTLNSNPYLFGLLVGVRQSVEERHDTETARRVTAALQSVLGALGDALTWTAWRPAMAMLAAIAGILAGVAGIALVWLVFAAGQAWLRIAVLRWGRARGLEAVGALESLGLRRWAQRGRELGGLAAGVVSAWVVAAEVLARAPGVTSVGWENAASAGAPAVERMIGTTASVLALVVGTVAGWRRWRGERTLWVTALALWLLARSAAALG